jgi:transcriptional regulator with XRE-family HTH domain
MSSFTFVLIGHSPALAILNAGEIMPKKRRTTKIARPEVVRQFAERLRQVRRTVGFTQRELAEKAHLSEGYVARLEAGDTSPGLDLMSRLAAALNVSLTDLLPAATPSTSLDALQLQARHLCDEVAASADRTTLTLLTSFLARLAGR